MDGSHSLTTKREMVFFPRHTLTVTTSSDIFPAMGLVLAIFGALGQG